MENIRDTLKSIKTLSGKLSEFAVERAPQTPHALFLQWLRDAIDENVPEPNVMTLSTVDSEGAPDARAIVLLNVDGDGWHFAANAASPKGRQLKQQPLAALSFYWPAQGKQIRLRGKVAAVNRDVSAADFLSRPEKSRAGILTARQSSVLEDRSQLESALATQLARIAQEPALVSNDWNVYALAPSEVEFWQSDDKRRFTRLRYQWQGQQWRQHMLWP